VRTVWLCVGKVRVQAEVRAFNRRVPISYDMHLGCDRYGWLSAVCLQHAVWHRLRDLPQVNPVAVRGRDQMRDMSPPRNVHRVLVITLAPFEVLTLERMH
jgi:hypothetical protein